MKEWQRYLWLQRSQMACYCFIRVFVLVFLSKWIWNTHVLLGPLWDAFIRDIAKDYWRTMSCPVNQPIDIIVCICVFPLLYFIVFPASWYFIYLLTVTRRGKELLSVVAFCVMFFFMLPKMEQADDWIDQMFEQTLQKTFAKIVDDCGILPYDLCETVTTYS